MCCGKKAVASFNVARTRPGACVLDNQIVVVSGESSAVEVYDEKKNMWLVVGNAEKLKMCLQFFHVDFCKKSS